MGSAARVGAKAAGGIGTSSDTAAPTETTGGATTSEAPISTSVEAAGAVGGEAGLDLKEVEKEEGLERGTVGGALEATEGNCRGDGLPGTWAGARDIGYFVSSGPVGEFPQVMRALSTQDDLFAPRKKGPKLGKERLRCSGKG